ncbi:NAD(P)/FAD-dependent oxidoreductase [Oricola cellulosilytica]|uniref:Pyridine nucleotide-disulfide oxidoreductase n=1 Tax=Oricola cellulosilytica TaxID=1429082 RepID=A0A4R0P8U2_9HYPH|nr:FAD-dependent oxidoreductase [Oricola cellulosilytica]TCD13503.1 pyridine nucleotide-disulfide oxidoreductase [Oricola cellulosilytica]
MPHTVIIGGSHAAVAAAAALRHHDPDMAITLVCEESELPYQRPPLSKSYMSGDMSLARLRLRPAEWYSDNHIDLKLGVAATSIDRSEKLVRLAGDTTIPFDTLVLATGASARRFPANSGGELPNVRVMRTLDDANELMETMKPGRKLIVIGGGYIGLEAAAEAAKKELEVTVIEAADRILKRVACRETADAFRALHAAHGVTVMEDTQIARINEKDGVAVSVTLSDGRELPLDLAVVGIGISPNAELAEAAGLEVAVGIAVDEHGRTSDPSIYAAGDCTILPFQNMPTRLESVQNAHDQAAAVAANIAGIATVYDPHPWFWSDQYDLKLQIAGLNRGYDSVIVRPGKREGSVSHFYFRQGRFIAVDCLNDAATYAMSRKLLEAGAEITADQIADEGFDLRAAVKALPGR